MFKRLVYLCIYFILIQGVLASPQSFSTRIRGEVYLRNIVFRTGKVTFDRLLLVRNDDPEVTKILHRVFVMVSTGKITVFPVDTVRKILTNNGVDVNVIVGERIIFVPVELSSYGDLVKEIVDSLCRVHRIETPVELNSLFGGLTYQLENLKAGKMLDTNFVVLDRKQGKGLLYVNYKGNSGEISVLKIVVRERVDKFGNTSGGFSRAGENRREKDGVVLVKSGSPLKIVFVNGGIVVRVDGYCVSSGKYLYGDMVRVKPIGTGKYFRGKVIGDGEVLVEIR